MTKIRSSIDLLILQSTSFCNIDCDYCYLPGRSKKGAMQFDVLKRVHEQIIDSPFWTDRSTLLWHAGEPLTLGCDWYNTAHRILDNNTGFLNRIQFQTNGILLNDDWISFLKEAKAGIGLSIDGPEWLHNIHRKDRSGNGTFSKALNAANLLHERGIPFTNIATITSDSIVYPELIFDFFLELKPIKLGFNIEEAEGSNLSSSMYNEKMIHEIEVFFKKIAARAFDLAAPFRIREVETTISGMFVSEITDWSSQEAELGRIISIGAAGDVALFSPELLTSYSDSNQRKLTVGNILKDDLAFIIGDENAKAQHAEINAGVAKCREKCEYFRFCLGGAPANKFFESGRFDVSETWHCKTSKMAVTRGILSAIKECGRNVYFDQKS